MRMISKQQLSLILKQNKEIDKWLDLINEILPKYKINTDLRVAAFLSQMGHESSDFVILTENLNYTAPRLLKVFPRHFNEANVNDYAGQPEKIANKVYGNRMANGPESSGDGWRFRGRGIIQLTGRENYARQAKRMGMALDEFVQFVITPKGALESACVFWVENGLNELADKGDVLSITKRINGGTNGLKDRQTRYENAIKVLSGNELADNEFTVGARGEEVRKLQEALNVPADGIFGPTTLMELKRFQKKAGLEVTGIADKITLNKLYKG